MFAKLSFCFKLYVEYTSRSPTSIYCSSLTCNDKLNSESSRFKRFSKNLVLKNLLSWMKFQQLYELTVIPNLLPSSLVCTTLPVTVIFSLMSGKPLFYNQCLKSVKMVIVPSQSFPFSVSWWNKIINRPIWCNFKNYKLIKQTLLISNTEVHSGSPMALLNKLLVQASTSTLLLNHELPLWLISLPLSMAQLWVFI